MASLADYFPQDDPLRPKLSPLVYVEPRDKLPDDEYARQSTFIAHIRKHARGMRSFAIRNGAYIASNRGRAKAHGEGLHKGWPDTGNCWGAVTAWIEFKDGREMPDTAQIETLNWLAERGQPVAVCRTTEGALRWLKGLGAPVAAVL